MSANVMVPLAQVAEQLGKGFARVETLHGSTYHDNRTVLIVPMRGPMIHHRVAQTIHGMISPPNSARVCLFVVGHEVGHAYNAAIANVLADPVLSTWRYVMTVEDDNLPPPDAHIRLLESIERHQLDGCSAIYFTRGEWNIPQAWGDPRRGPNDFQPCDITGPLERGEVLRVNGIGMGCALWRMDLFRQIPAPWYVTCADVVPEGGAKCMTQDLYFCQRARLAGKNFGVDMRVKVGHMDVNTGEVY